jgi:hypothetical protein
MRLLRCLIVSASAAAMAGAVTLSGVAATTVAAPARASHAPSARFLAEARTALVHYLRHNHPQAMLVHTRHAHAVENVTATQSFNWSGYADVTSTKQEFTKVSGSWTTPSVTCNAEDQVISNWVGFDGFALTKFPNNTVEQLGTISWCFQAKPIYFTWYEMFPKGTIEVGTALKPGDKISASVTRTGTSYALDLTDSTTAGNNISVTKTCALTTCKAASAEWISERPAFNTTGIVPQAHYNAFKLTNGAQTSNGTAGTIGTGPGVNAITMIDSTQTYNLNTVSGLTGGNSFSTTWKNSY